MSTDPPAPDPRHPAPEPRPGTIAAEALGSVLFTDSPFSSVLYDREGRVLAVNRAFERMWGVTLETAPPGYSVLADPELERQGLLPTVRRAFAGEAVVTPPVRYDISRVARTGTGRALWTQGHFYPLRDAEGRVTHVVLTHVDLTEQKEAEEAAREQAERFRLAQRAAEIGTFDWSVPTGEVAWTEEEERIFGLEPGSFGGTIAGWAERVLPEDRARMEREMGECMARGEREMDFAFRIRRPDGEVRWIEGSATFVYAPGGAPLRMVGVNVDVTDRARLMEAERAARAEAERARAAAEEASRAKSEFLAVMSHELRTPLNAIAGYAELIELGIRGPVTDAQREDLRRIQQSQRHLLRLINEVLNYARVEAGAVAYRCEPTRVAEVVAATEALVQPQVAAKGLTLHRGEIGPGLVAWADPEKLQQVLLNLLSNAVKFTRGGGRVGIEAAAAGEWIAIRVRDTGIGIPPEKLESVFEPFVQVGRGLSNPGEGTGLGLAISRDLARGMGGELRAESEPGVGSTFTLLVPCCRDAGEAEAGPPPPAADAAGPDATSDRDRDHS